MSDSLAISRTQGRVVILHLTGRLDVLTQQKLVDGARSEHDSGTRFLLVDLQGVEMITSAGLAALHTIYKMFTPQEELNTWEREKHGEPYKSLYFKLAGASANVYYVLNISGFLHNIPIYPSMEEALRSFPE
jgi:ABC-type transporter Mla MlaB component